jgi:1-acyl-sn-glycerol-3-phosphate acyltransferase
MLFCPSSSSAESPLLWWLCNGFVGVFFIVAPICWVLLRLRVVPAPLMRVWFMLVSILNLSMIRIGCELMNLVLLRLMGKTVDDATYYHAVWCHYTFKLQTLLNPQIRIRGCDKKSAEALASLPERAFICLNHTSQYDPFVFVGWIPLPIITTCRTLYKYSLQKTPIFGPVYDYCGHFPVYFKGGESFSVDADKQKIVSDKMIDFVDNRKGRLSMFPEGQLNKNPAQLQPFRFGSLKFALEHKMPVYFFVLWGPQDTWPVADSFGGLPADIAWSVEKFEIKDYDAALQDIENFAKTMQVEMQRIVDGMNKKKQ